MSDGWQSGSEGLRGLIRALEAPSAGYEREVLSRAYMSLPGEERALVQALSLAFTGLNRTALSGLLREAMEQAPRAWEGARSKDLRAPALRKPLETMQRRGVVVSLDGGTIWACHPLLQEVAARQAQAEDRIDPLTHALLHAGASRDSPEYWRHSSDQALDRLFRDLRLALYAGDTEELAAIDMLLQATQTMDWSRWSPLGLVAGNPFDPSWIERLPSAVRNKICANLLVVEQWHLRDGAELALLLSELPAPAMTENPSSGISSLGYLVNTQLLLRGRPDLLKQWIGGMDPMEADAQDGWVHVLQGDDNAAVARFSAALTVQRRDTGKRKQVLPGLAGLFHLISLIRRGEAKDLHLALRLAEAGEELAPESLSLLYRELREVVGHCLGEDLSGFSAEDGGAEEWGNVAPLRPKKEERLLPTLGHLFSALFGIWLSPDQARPHIPMLRALAQQAKDGGYRWVEAEARELLSRLDPDDEDNLAHAGSLWREMGLTSICDTVKPVPPWERALDALDLLANTGQGRGEQEARTRLAWMIHYEPERRTCQLEPRQQKRTKKGRWSKGAEISLKRLREQQDRLGFLLPQDRTVCSLILTAEEGARQARAGRGLQLLDHGKALRALAGHPHLYWSHDGKRRVEVVAGEPELRVTLTHGQVLISLHPPLGLEEARLQQIQRKLRRPNRKPWNDPELRQESYLLEDMLDERREQGWAVVVEREGPDRLKATVVEAEQMAAARLLGDQGLRVPPSARKRVEESISALANLMPVSSDIGGAGAAAQEVEADSRPLALCSPLGAGIMVELMVRPLGEGGPSYRPGVGGATVLAEVVDKRLQARRDLELEASRAEAVIAACPALQRAEYRDGARLMPESDDALQALLELGELGDEVHLAWPRGEAIRVRPPVSLNRLHLSIHSRKDWFEVDGKLQVDNDLVLDMRRLLELAAQSKGAFISLGEGEFLALTRELRRRLEELGAYTEARATGLRFNPLAAPAFEELAQEVGELDADQHFLDLLDRQRQARELDPHPPSTLRATLRDYQVEGFRWLARLACWGVGACLADDMGLGKTIQALALILERAGQGPSLVVAPTSVCMNWEREAARFAPTLQVHVMGSGDREGLVSSLGPRDVLICTYGLLVREAELLSGLTWNTLVLDEAQAIKNAATKRARAAMKLQAEMKLATTGTPVENRLLELWTLFRFLNPGLLGSRESFNQRFALPIERDSDASARALLKKLVRPFILRRTKDQVLDDLPPRTDVLRQISMGAEEAALYEALRRQAVERMVAAADLPAGQRQVRVLAEITRMRRACCNPRLVTPESVAPSAKMEALDELLSDLLSGGHKALIFSQFVGHLTLIRAHLDQQGISYQYLDGSTPTKARRSRVDAFQGGDGELFLISLKAGGLGLNLTAADYVIHMDPWWNPAVEDQASDRVHRIGQRRPVTTFRLVLSGTIEDKIVDMHRAKRGLVRDLLDGTDGSALISTDELLALLMEG